jgi:hypothetical protein
MKIKTNELTGAALDWAVATADNYDEGWLRRQLTNPNPHTRSIPAYSTDWAHGGPIIEREKYDLAWEGDRERWVCFANDTDDDLNSIEAVGHTPLIAAMRCYVASKLGPEIDIPEELL